MGQVGRMRQVGRRVRGRAVVAAAVAAAGALGVGACGSVPVLTSLTTGRAIGASFSGLGRQRSLSLTFSIGSTTAQLEQLDHEPGSTPLTAAQIQAITQTTVRVSEVTTDGRSISAEARTPGASPEEDLTLTVAHSTPVELREVGGSLYLRADIPELLTDYNVDPTKADGATSGLRAANAEVPGLAALADGRWVSVSAASLHALEAQARSAEGAKAAADAQEVTADLRKLGSDLRSTLRANTTYANLGTHSGRTEYGITANVHNVVFDMLADARGLIGTNQVLGSILSKVQAAAARIPATQTATVDEYVEHDKVEELDIDLSQFTHKLTAPLVLRTVIGTASAVSAPSSSTPVDLSKVFGELVHPAGGFGLPGCAALPAPPGQVHCG